MLTLSSCVAGCDPHLDTITMSVINQIGEPVKTVTVPNTTSGWDELTELCTRSQIDRIGIEGASGFGRCLAETLIAAGLTVIEIPTRITAATRRIDGAAKTDPGDSIAVARAVARGDGSVWRDQPDLETVRLLVNERDRQVRDQTRAVNQLRAMLTELDPGLAASLGRLGRSKAPFHRLTQLVYQGDTRRDTLSMLIRQTATECLERLDRIATLTTLIDQHLPPAGHELQTIHGCGTIAAGIIIGELAGTAGFTSDAKLAAWAGTAPLDASSGRQQRHRLNHGGNRQVNRAIHTIVITQLQTGGEAAHYINRRITEGKTKKEAVRAAKRHLTRKIWKIIHKHHPHLT